jgi:Fe-S oxidoreductase/nitrate reductase gamma subunit
VTFLLGADTETRKIFEDIDLLGKGIFYILSIVAVGVFAFGCWRRVQKYRSGRSTREHRPSWLSSLAQIAANTTVARGDRPAGVAHFFVFWGFLTLFAGTVILTVDYDIVRTATAQLGDGERSFFEGTFYLVYSFTLDTMGLAAVIGLVYLGARRRVGAKPELDYTRAEEPEDGYSRSQFERGDILFVGLLGLVLITGFLEEGFRIRASGFPDFEVWSPVGWVLAKAVSGLGFTEAASSTVRTGFWWLHVLAAFGFVALIPFTKALHMLTDPADLVVHDPTSSRTLPTPAAAADHVGYQVLADFTWKELLGFDSCTKCGRCHVVCPAHAAGAPLSPRDLILDLRQWADRLGGSISLLDHEERPNATGPLAGDDAALVGEVIPPDTLWACTTCMACVEACPVGIEHVPTIVEMRRSLVDSGEMEPALQDVLQNLAQKGNSFGKSARQRARWTKELDFDIPDARKQRVRYLWFVGDFAAFDDRLQASSRALARVLHRADVNFGLLNEAERNAGNDVRRVGEEGLFELLVEQNLEAFGEADFDEIFTTDPHSLNTLRNEYPEFGLDKPVRHYTEVLADLFDSDVLEAAPLDRRVTYHDPCYLARYNGTTEAPRRLLAALGCEVVEMPRNRENTFCCGAGGGRIWMDDSGLEERPSENRIREAAGIGVDTFVVSCPKDFTMYTDAAKTTGQAESMAVVDIVELVTEALDPTRLASAGASR